MSLTTPAAVLRELGQPLEIRELELPDLKPGQVLVDVAFSAACDCEASNVKSVPTGAGDAG